MRPSRRLDAHRFRLLGRCHADRMHPRTPKRLERFAETHRQVGAICNAAKWLEYQLEIAVSELSRTEDLTEMQGQRWRALVDKLKSLLIEGAVTEDVSVASLRARPAEPQPGVSAWRPQSRRDSTSLALN